jgi:hypothetical protein
VSHSFLGRVLRPAILLAAGILIGQGALTIAAPATPAATTQTRIASCSGFDFHPIDSRTTEAWEGRVKYRRDNEGDGWFMCNPNLPHRAIVTKVRFTVKDALQKIDLQFCGLVRTSLGTGGGIDVVGMPITGTGMSSVPGILRQGTTAISFKTVDNGAFAYSLQCQIVFHDTLFEIAGAYAGIIGADVTYKISSTNG